MTKANKLVSQQGNVFDDMKMWIAQYHTYNANVLTVCLTLPDLQRLKERNRC